MEKVALMEIGTTSIRLTLSKVVNDEYFFIYKELSERINIDEHIESEDLLKSTKIKECIALLKMYKKICESEGVSKFLCVASNNITQIKNYSSFIDEAISTVGLEIKILTPDEEVNAVYTSAVNTLDVPKGVIVNISSHSTKIIHYNRRVILDSFIIPHGSVSLFKTADNDIAKSIEVFKNELNKHTNITKSIDSDSTIIGVSDIFVSCGRLSRKMQKYPVDIDHNYCSTSDSFSQVFNYLKGLDVEKRAKIKGIPTPSVEVLLCGMCIIEAVLQFLNLKQIVVCNSYRNSGLMFNHAIPYTQERSVSDVLGYSLGATVANSGLNSEDSECMYELSVLLFKQLKVLHKLPRLYAKVLRIASYLYHIGKSAHPTGYEKINYYSIISSPLVGVTHKELVLASFATSFKKWEDFNLAEWVKYKDLITNEDLEAVRKISVLIAIAEALNLRRSKIVKDISCDILGDSVILKLITDTDTKSNNIDIKAAYLEAFYAKKYCGEFQKAFKKNLEIL